ncbi:DUF4097 family beta strand repeat-containing protein [Lysinibacillus antri]|uniref:DUF4097 domain-containing protein n=1 Tax=Lysinibacillus antri TaxID=2498145 RepID=A0A432L7V5_9BACI|nr:DUF4097 family beta strand repeat-containing protein [Lysinibacillus antri]RUL47904.1 hypothetical protein EK386_17695 [Lysinibacillus antri]
MAISAVTFVNLFSMNSPEEVVIQKEFTNAEIETNNADIILIPTKDQSARVELENGRNKYKIDAQVNGNTLEIDMERKFFRWFSIQFFSKTPILKVYLPESLAGTIQIESDNGTIKASGFETKEIIAETDNGEVILDNLKVQTLYVDSSNGELLLENIEGKIVGETSNGDISVRTAALKQPIELETNNGTIYVQTENEPKDAFFDVKTGNGEVIIFGKRNPTTESGNSQTTIKLTSNNGDIIVEK